MNNTQEDQQGVEESLRIDETIESGATAIMQNSRWYFSPDPQKRYQFQIVTATEKQFDPFGSQRVANVPYEEYAKHICKLHNDWLQFKENKRLKKKNKLLDALKADYTLYKKGFEVLRRDAGFDLTGIGGKELWVSDPGLADRITEFIKDNKTDIEKALFLFWYKWHFNDMNMVISRYYTGKGCNQFLDHFTDITMFDTKNTRTHWAYNEWHCKTKDEVEWLISDIAANPELNTPITFKEPNSVAAYGSMSGLTMMIAMASAVHAWAHKVKKLTEPAQALLSGNADFSIKDGTYTERKINCTDDVWGTAINKHPVKCPTTCMRGKSCKDGCEFYDKGFCRGVCYPTCPPKYKRCDFENNGNAGQTYFTDEEINGFRGETNEPNCPGTNWKVGEPLPAPVLDEYEIKELIKKHGERMVVEDEDGESRIYRRLELENPVHEPKFMGLNPVYDVLALRCPEEEDEETCLFEMECKVVCPPSPTLVVLSNDGLMIDSQLDLAAEVKSTVENLVKLSGRQVGKNSVHADAAREFAKMLLGKGVVEEADRRVKEFLGEDGVEQILVIKINDKDAIEYFAGLEEDYDLTKLKFAFRSEGQGNGGSYRYYDTSDTVEVYAETITFTVGNSTAHKLGMDGKFKENYQKLFEVAMNNPQVNDLFDHICGPALLKPVQPINGIAINLTPGSIDTMLRQKTTATYDNLKEWEKAHENHGNPVYDAECKIDHTVPQEKDEQSIDRSGAHKPLTVTKNTIKELPQTYYVERSFKDIVSHLHDDEKIRAVVCFNSRLMSYMPPTDNKTITIVNFLGHTKSMAELYKQWMIPEGKQVEEFLSHDWWYDEKKKMWTYVCNIGCENDPFQFMTLTPVLWDNHTYLGKDKDYKEAPFKYTDG